MALQDEENGEGAAGAQVVVRRRPGHAVRIARWLLLGLVLLLAVALVGLWTARVPIANDIIARELQKRGVTASYTLDRIGFRTQQVSNLVIGDPARPDLTARRAVIQMRIKWNADNPSSEMQYGVTVEPEVAAKARRAVERALVWQQGQLGPGR